MALYLEGFVGTTLCGFVCDFQGVYANMVPKSNSYQN